MKSIRFLALAVCAALVLPINAAQATDPTGSRQSSVDTYIVHFREPGLLYYTGDNGRSVLTAPASTGERRLNARSGSASLAYGGYLQDLQQRMARFEGMLQREIVLRHSYHVTFNGVAVDVSADEAERLRTLPEVASIEKSQTYEIDTDAGPTLIGAPGVERCQHAQWLAEQGRERGHRRARRRCQQRSPVVCQ